MVSCEVASRTTKTKILVETEADVVTVETAERPVNQMVAPCCLRSSLRSLRIGGAVLAPIADCVWPPHRHRQHVNTTKPQQEARAASLN
ncbi:hypothetical protein KCV06_g66, partial [Aureobasidium melanogenum]